MGIPFVTTVVTMILFSICMRQPNLFDDPTRVLWSCLVAAISPSIAAVAPKMPWLAWIPTGIVAMLQIGVIAYAKPMDEWWLVLVALPFSVGGLMVAPLLLFRSKYQPRYLHDEPAVDVRKPLH
ncbi:MAG: hypothetical protein SFX74_13220 [Fimbriimonadaceae bacterium]|nr:hypothetical protein [Fimbriimonadaceae bacterium]